MAYQLMTQNVGKYHHLGNTKVYFIINLSETVLWTVIMIVGVSTNIGRCTSGSEKGSTSCVVFFALSAIAGTIGYVFVSPLCASSFVPD